MKNIAAEMEKTSNIIFEGIKPDLTAYTTIDRIEKDKKLLLHVSVSRGSKRLCVRCGMGKGIYLIEYI